MDGRNFRIDLGYDGTDFFGSQRQSGVRTVQGVLEETLIRLTGEATALVFAGRTDRGVHAVGQVASTRLVWTRSAMELARALEALTPDDLAVYSVIEVGDDFHARYGAVWREYRYRVWSGEAPPVLLSRYAWWIRQRVDLAAMQSATCCLIGRQDFAAVAGSGRGVPWSRDDTVRAVGLAEWRLRSAGLERGDRGSQLVEFRIRADGFLPQMVRNIVGVLAEIGRGRQPEESLAALLAARDRRRAPAPAPARGLALWRVGYAEDGRERVDRGANAKSNTRVEGDEDILTESI